LSGINQLKHFLAKNQISHEPVDRKPLLREEFIIISDKSLELSRKQQQIDRREKMILGARSDMLQDVQGELGEKDEQITND
jgi:hypothetical protein